MFDFWEILGVRGPPSSGKAKVDAEFAGKLWQVEHSGAMKGGALKTWHFQAEPGNEAKKWHFQAEPGNEANTAKKP